MGLELNKATWAILVAISMALTFLLDRSQGLAFVMGGVLGTFIFPAILLWLVILVAKLFKTSPSRSMRRAVFLSLWGFVAVSQLSRFSQRPVNDHDGFVAECVRASRDSADFDIDARMDVQKYCECAYWKLKERKGVDMAELLTIRDRNSVLFNELALSCAKEAMFAEDSSVGSVWGVNTSDTVPVLNVQGRYKVKLTFGSDESYFLFDSGASDCVVSGSMGEKMSKSGMIQGYLVDMAYEMANGELMNCKRAIVNDIQIGGFVVDSAIVAIYDGEIENLLGLSFMDKFTSWRFSAGTNELVLEK